MSERSGSGSGGVAGSVSLSVSGARALAVRALVVLGYSPADAATIADHLLDCELRGLGMSGLARIVSIAERLGSAGPVVGPSAATVTSPSSTRIDGRDRIGYLVADEATTAAIAHAESSGIGLVGAHGTWYTGMLSHYAERIVERGLVAMLASSATPWVAPHGGTQPVVGTNPICFAFPSDGDPFVWDIGTSSIIHADVVLAERLGLPLPSGVAFDASGAPTTSPTEALAGAFTTWGGHRGSGLALVVQLLGALAGAPVAPGHLQDFGMVVLAIDPGVLGAGADAGAGAASLGGAAALRASVAELQASLADTAPVDPAHPVRAPFARSIAERRRRLAADAIEVPTAVVDAVRALADGVARA
ncbi:Ldh family oxidoreductase [Agrococcus jejuensis]|uniref:Malate/lactate/ureidoglycolate dehydrogenase, LDH2 family n=1 Tax=Agrococcus jejuensis TaxID=399736 RepID=A0A1G8CB66_9MICO|nr:Ldh family oxidoreductase [Agrococcus jejuensis]SDH42711.1 Malate/lactate/ureidoglycolate dehydrogenase, LDH2 family [Agrococcus jejuensis]